MEKKSVTTPTWSRALLVIFGLVAIAASIFVLAVPGIALITLVFLLSFSLLFVGLSRIARGISLSALSKGHRVLDVLAGLLGIAIGIIVFLFPLLGLGTLVFMLAFGTMIYGIVSVAIGASASRLTKGVRALVVLIGILAIILSVIVLASPAVAVLTLIFLLSVSFMVNGIESIVLAFE
ncbi:MAG TPA: DUF308 domain-containing protein [Candidatus Saccharimonadales bacterium]|nr:DUF308 domain-containing protein [Candidatus Saccharimonadales bacterium]